MTSQVIVIGFSRSEHSDRRQRNGRSLAVCERQRRHERLTQDAGRGTVRRDPEAVHQPARRTSHDLPDELA